MKKNRTWLTDLSLFFIVSVWGVNYSVVKGALFDFSPLSFNGLRFLLASVVLFLLLRGSEKRLPRFGRDWARVVLVGILGNTVYQVLFIIGMDWTLAGNTSLILATTPAYVALFSMLLDKEKVSARMWTGILSSFVGVALVVVGGRHAGELGHGLLRGDLTELLAAIVWSFYVVLSAPLIRRYGALATSASTLWIGGTVLFLVSLPSLAHQNWARISRSDWGGLLFSGVFSIALGQILWYRAVGERGNTRTSVYSNLTPLIGVFVAWPLLGETPRLLQLLGALFILSGIFLTGLQYSSPSAE